MDMAESSSCQTESCVLSFTCPDCQKSFHWKQHLNRHWKNVHKKPLSSLPYQVKSCQKENQHYFSCPSSDCTESFLMVKHLTSHLIDSHNINADIKQLKFSDWDSFLIWKEKEEEDSNAHFIQSTGVKKSRMADEDVSRYYFSCCRDGQYRNNTWTKRKTEKKILKENQKSSRKLNDRCISRLYVTVTCSGVEVEYLPVHTNHSLKIEDEMKHLPLSQSVKKEICNKFISGIPVTRVLQDVRGGIGNREDRPNFKDNCKRRHLITKQDCYNQRKKVLKWIDRRHDNDATSVEIIVEELRQEKYNSVLLYKPQGSLSDDYPQLSKTSFALAIQTEFQKDLFQTYAETIVCIDSTHSTNAYDFKLTTVLVEDEFGEGQPIAWLISDREDHIVIKIFLNAIKSRSPDTIVKTLMTDDDNTGWLATCEVYGNDIKHLLCHWHVDQSWKRNIRKMIADKDHSSEIYQTLHILMAEPTLESYHRLLGTFEDKWATIYPAFMDYFNKYYSSRSSLWAKCFRRFDHGDTDTNMYLESFHNKLKNNPAFMDGHANKRVDTLVSILMKFEENMFFERKTKELLWKPNRRHSEEIKRHYKAKQIKVEDIEEIGNKQWKCRSQTEDDLYYTMTLIDRHCTSLACHSKCVDCSNLCRHMFECSCYDYANGHLCKHLHGLQMKLTSESNVIIPTETTELESTTIAVHDAIAFPIPGTSTSLTTKVTECKKIIAELGLLLEENCAASIMPVLEHIHTLLQNALSSAKAVVSTSALNTPVGAFVTKKSICPGQRLEKQPQFHRTTKSRNCVAKHILKKADASRRLDIIKSLDTEQALNYLLTILENDEDSQAQEITSLPIYCICRKPDDGSLMVECTQCKEWYHLHCLTLTVEELPNGDWYCNNCI